MISAMPEAVFFDWDGTLVNSIPMLHRAHNHVRVHFDLPAWSMKEFRDNMHNSSRDIYPKIYGGNVDEAFTLLYQYVEDHHLNDIEAFPMAMDLLRLLSDWSIPMSVISNKKHEYVVKEVQTMGVFDLFDNVIGSGRLDVDKPSGRPILETLAMSSLKPHPENIWYVGDSDTDLMASNDAGVASILLAQSPRKEDLIAKFSPFLAFNSCKDLHDALIQCKQSNSTV